MFPSMTERRQNKRSLRELVRGAMDTALELVTLGEARAFADRERPPPPSCTRTAGRSIIVVRRRRAGMTQPRPQVCTSPVHRPATKSRT